MNAGYGDIFSIGFKRPKCQPTGNPCVINFVIGNLFKTLRKMKLLAASGRGIKAD
jgi:hypothetical protein